MEETTLQEAQLQIERKTFVFNLRENSRGRFLRITEGGTGKRNTVIIPASGLDEFSRVFSAMARSEGELAENGPGNEG